MGEQQSGTQPHRVATTGIHHDMREAAGKLLAFGQDRFAREACRRRAGRVSLILSPPRGPARGTRLRVAVNQQGLALPGQHRGEMDGGRGLSHAAFGIDHSKDRHVIILQS